VKVGYITLDGYESTAYLDERDGEYWVGTDKHTDALVKVYWNDDDEVRAWIEVR
jgi:hypothetical protein